MTAQAMPFKFRTKWLKLDGTAEKIERDFDDILAALTAISVTYNLNMRLYELLLNGFLFNEDQTECVTLTGVYKNGTEEMISHPLIAGQMGSPQGALLGLISKVVSRD